MNTSHSWRQIELPFDLGKPSKEWECPFCRCNTVLVVNYQDKQVYLHARGLCVKTVWVAE